MTVCSPIEAGFSDSGDNVYCQLTILLSNSKRIKINGNPHPDIKKKITVENVVHLPYSSTTTNSAAWAAFNEFRLAFGTCVCALINR